MGLQHYAYHRLYLPDGSVLPMQVVDVDEQGNVVSYHPLAAEEANTVWVGGDFRIPTPNKHEL